MTNEHNTHAAAPSGAAVPPAVTPISAVELVSPLPEVNPQVARVEGAAAAPGAASPGTAAAPAVDKAGRTFDAKTYRTNKDGTPFVSKRGLFMPRGGRKPGLAGEQMKIREVVRPVSVLPSDPAAAPGAMPGAVPAPAPGAQPGAVPPPPAAAPKITPEVAEQNAEALLRIAYSLGDSLVGAAPPPPPPGEKAGGSEWSPDDDAEHAAMRATLAAYLQTRNSAPVSPGLALLIQGACYVWKRLARSKTAAWVAKWNARLFGRKTNAPAAGAAPGGATRETPPAAPAARSWLEIAPHR